MTSVFPYVTISTNTHGERMIEVSYADPRSAVTAYEDTMNLLKNKGFRVASSDNDVKTTSENTKFLPQVTVSGKGSQVVDQFISESKRLANGGES